MSNEHRDEEVEKMFQMFEAELNKLGLNGEVLSTIVREFTRLSRNANHEQIHALLSLLESIHYACSIQHMIIAGKDGTHGGLGRE